MNSLDVYVEKFNLLSLTSVGSILEIGSLMVSVKNDLTTVEYQEFLHQTKYSEKSSSVRKWEVIGHAYLRLKQISHKLPPYWSTIYKLASLDVDQLDTLDQQGILTKTLTVRELNIELNPKFMVDKSDIDVETDESKLNESDSNTDSKKSCTQFLIIEIDTVQVTTELIKNIIHQIEEDVLTPFMTIKLSDELKELLTSQ